METRMKVFVDEVIKKLTSSFNEKGFMKPSIMFFNGKELFVSPLTIIEAEWEKVHAQIMVDTVRLNAKVVIMVTEGWALHSDDNNPIPDGLDPLDSDRKIEVLSVSVETQEMAVLYQWEIKRDKDKPYLGEMKIMENEGAKFLPSPEVAEAIIEELARRKEVDLPMPGPIIPGFGVPMSPVSKVPPIFLN